DRELARCHARLERRVGLIREPVIVLDYVDAGARERVAEIRKSLGRQTLRLERRAGERAPRNSDLRTKALDAEPGPGEPRDEVGWKLRIRELDVLVQRAVAEQHVDRLRGVASGRRGRESNDDIVPTIVDLANPAHLADDVLQHESVMDRFE